MCVCVYIYIYIYIYIENSSRHVGQTHFRFPKYLCMFGNECNAHQIDILDKFNANLTNTSSTPPPEGKEQYCM